MTHPIEPFLETPLKDLVQPTQTLFSEELKERHRIYIGALSSLMRHYWCGNKYGLDGSYPRNPDKKVWKDLCPNLGNEYRGHNIAAFAVDHNGLIVDFDFNHNALFDSSVDHAEARLVRRIFSLTQVHDSWNLAGSENPSDKYGNALSRVTIYTSLESCTQCTGIMMLGRVKEVVYLQSDPGMYRIGDFLHTLTSRKSKKDYINAPEPIAASRLDSKIQESLDSAYSNFVATKDDEPAFFISADGTPKRTESITSFLCTEDAIQAFSDEADNLSSLPLKFPEFRPKCDGDKKCDVEAKLTNQEVLSEALSFVSYAKQKGERGTPHR